MAPAYGAAFGGIDNDQPEIKARQRHRANLIRNQDTLRKISTTKKLPRSFVMGSPKRSEKQKEPNHNFKGNTEGNSYVPVDLYFKCSRRAALNFSFLSVPCGGGRITLFKRGSC